MAITTSEREVLKKSSQEVADLLSEEISGDEKRVLKKIFDEGYLFFQETKKSIEGGAGYEALCDRLLDNNVILSKRRRVPIVEFTEELGRIKKIFQALDDAKASPENIQVRKIIDYSKIEISAEDVGNEVKKEETFEISFRFSNSKEIGINFFRNLLGTHPTIALDGYLGVILKKMSGKWYWNPFGW